jgi:ficolin
MNTDGGGWTVFQRRKDGSVNFKRNWCDYAYGFGNLTGEFWLGNDLLSAITNSVQFKLRVDMRDPADVLGFSEYTFFLVTGSADDYRMLGLGTYSGTGGDSLTVHKGQKFTTFERDHDNSGENCAALFIGAWWYNNCHESNLNGDYGNKEISKGVIWGAFRGHAVSLKSTEMKIRRK